MYNEDCKDKYTKGLNMIRQVLATSFALLVLSGCASPPMSVSTPSVPFSNDLVTGALKIVCDKPTVCTKFELSMSNSTSETVEIDWNKSYYLNNGKPDGGLYFDGIVVAQRNNPRSPDIILPRTSFQKTLVPNNSLELALFPLAHWSTKNMAGQLHGVYLTLKTKSKEDVINVSVDLTSMNR